MAKFDQRGQYVVNQTNADSVTSANFGTVQNKQELVNELRKLLEELNNAADKSGVNKETVAPIQSHIEKAISEVEKPEPKRKTILDHMEAATRLLTSVNGLTGFISALINAAKLIGILL